MQLSHRYGMILFIASEVMFFVAWFWVSISSLFLAEAVHLLLFDTAGGLWLP